MAVQEELQRNELDECPRRRIIAGARAGGLAAAILVLAVTVPLLMFVAFFDAEIRGMLPLLLVFALVAALAAGIGGSLVGALGTLTRRPILGALGGVFVFSLGAIVFTHFWISSREPREENDTILIWFAVMGYISGAVGTIFGRQGGIAESPVSYVLQRILLFLPPLVLVFFWGHHEWNHFKARSEIEASGGVITWTTFDNPSELIQQPIPGKPGRLNPGRWEIRLRGSAVGDTELEHLTSALAWYSPLDLDLADSRVTDSGLIELGGLQHLVRVRIDRTTITQEGVARLRRLRPNLLVLGE